MNGSRPSVTVVIPVRDDASLLRRCLEALDRQTWPPDEVIVVDDGSQDASGDVAADHGARVVSQSPRGIASASAAGYDVARGDLIARLDADSLPPDDWLERLLQVLIDDASIDAVTGDAWFLHASPRVRRRAASVYLGAYRAVLLPTLGHTPLFGSNMAFRRDVWSQVAAEVHRDDDLLHDDLDLSFHIGRTRRIRHVRGAPVGISARPLRLDGDLLHRVRRGFHTVVVHWPRDFPPLRWCVRARALRARATPIRPMTSKMRSEPT